MWKEIPGWASLLIFVFVLWLLGVMEGLQVNTIHYYMYLCVSAWWIRPFQLWDLLLQIALVELKRQNPDSYKDQYPTAYKLGQIASRGDNIEKFLMGRQVGDYRIQDIFSKYFSWVLRPGVCSVPGVLCCQVDHNSWQDRGWIPVPCSWLGPNCVPGDWTVGLCGCGHCRPADAPDCRLSLPCPVHGVGGHEARVLRLHWTGVLRHHTLLLGACGGLGLYLPDEEGAGGTHCCRHCSSKTWTASYFVSIV